MAIDKIIMYDDLLYYSILSVNNYVKNKNILKYDSGAVNSVNKWIKILNKNKISYESNYFDDLVNACKNLKKGENITLQVYNFKSFEHNLHSTRTQVYVFSKNYRNSFSY